MNDPAGPGHHHRLPPGRPRAPAPPSEVPARCAKAGCGLHPRVAASFARAADDQRLRRGVVEFQLDQPSCLRAIRCRRISRGWTPGSFGAHPPFALAARYDLVQFNPVTDAYRPPASRSVPRALTVEDVHELRGRVKAWQEAQRLGPKRAHDLVEIIDVMLGTGARIGEVARSALAGHPRSRRRRTCCGDDLWDRRDG